MAYILKDNQIKAYHECWDYVPGAVIAAGVGAVKGDVFGFNIVATTSTTEEVIFVYEAYQVEATKITGTGEDIESGEKVYATLGTLFQEVTANPTGTIGTDFYYVGIAKKDAGALDDTVLIHFIGDSYNHADEA